MRGGFYTGPEITLMTVVCTYFSNHPGKFFQVGFPGFLKLPRETSIDITYYLVVMDRDLCAMRTAVNRDYRAQSALTLPEETCPATGLSQKIYFLSSFSQKENKAPTSASRSVLGPWEL